MKLLGSLVLGGAFAAFGFLLLGIENNALAVRSVMIVSRGLGNSIIPIRLYNQPEIVSIRLRAHPQHQPQLQKKD